MRNTKKLLSVLLAGVMLVGMLPLAALAANDTSAEGWTDAESGAVEVVSEAGVTASARVYSLAEDAKVYEITLTGKLAAAASETVTVGLPFTGDATYRGSVYQVGNDTGSYTANLPASVTAATGTNNQKTYYAIAAGTGSVTFSVKAGSNYYNVTSSVAKADAAAAPKVTFTTADKNVTLPEVAEVEAENGAASIQVGVAEGYTLKAVCSPAAAKAEVTDLENGKWTVAVSNVTADTTVTLTAEQKTVDEVQVEGNVDQSGTLNVEVEITDSLNENADEIKIEISASSGTATAVSATLPQAAVEALKAADAAVTLGNENVGSITLPVEAVGKLAANDKVVIAPVADAQKDSKWTDATAFAMDFSIRRGAGKVEISGLTRNPIRLSFPVPSALTGLTGSNVRVFHYENGKYELMSGAAYDSATKTVSFTTPHLSSFVVMTEETAKSLGIVTKFEVTAPAANANVPGSMKVTAATDAGNYVTFNVLSSKVGGYYVTVKAGADGVAEVNAQLNSGDRVFAFVTKGELKLGSNKLPEGVLATQTVTAK